MLNLLAKYCVKERWEHRIRALPSQEKLTIEPSEGSLSPFKQQVDALVREICRNLISYCCRICESPLDPTKSCRILFTPNLSGAIATSMQFAPKTEQGTSPSLIHFMSDVPLSVTARGRLPSLAILVHLIKDCVNTYIKINKDQEWCRLKIERIGELSPEELTEVRQVHDKQQVSLFSLPRRRKHVYQKK